MKRWIGVLASCAAATQVAAATCEEDFAADGDSRNGLLFTAQVEVPGLAARSALGQLRRFAIDGGYEPGGELLAAGAGEFSFIQRGSRPPLVVRATAQDSGAVTLALKLAGGQHAAPDDVRSEFCGMLRRLKPGAEGEAVARAAREATGAERVIDADAVRLSADLGREMDRVMGPVARKGTLGRVVIGAGTPASAAEVAEAFAPVRATYVGRRYRIDGQVHVLSQDLQTREMTMAWLVTPRRGLLGIRQEASFNDLNFSLRCAFAADQARFFATLAEGNQVTLEGVVTEIEPGGMQLSECRRADR